MLGVNEIARYTVRINFMWLYGLAGSRYLASAGIRVTLKGKLH
jgi:hypothetical protein